MTSRYDAYNTSYSHSAVLSANTVVSHIYLHCKHPKTYNVGNITIGIVTQVCNKQPALMLILVNCHISLLHEIRI